MRNVNTKRILPLFLIIILLVLIKNIASSIIRLNDNGDIVTSLKNDLYTEERRNVFLNERLYYVKTNEFVESEAREKLGMVKEGEFIILAPPTHTNTKIAEIVDITPNWQKWWKLFF